MARTYGSLWAQVKEEREVQVHCALNVRERLRKALHKERGHDTEWRDANPTAILDVRKTEYGLHIRLHVAVRDTKL